MIKNILSNLKSNLRYDLMATALLILLFITSFLFINLDKILFWRSLFYLFVPHFIFLSLIVFIVRVGTNKFANFLINTIYIFIIYNFILRTQINPGPWVTIVNEIFGFENYNMGKIVLILMFGIIFLLSLWILIYKKITTQHLSYLFGIMLFSNVVVNVPNIYNNIINNAEEFIELEQPLVGEPLYKNPDRSNIYVLMIDTYPSFYNTKNYLNFDNAKLKNYLNQNNFTIYEKMYSNMPSTRSSMSVFFGHENRRSKSYTYYGNPKNAGHYLRQKYLTQLKDMGYNVYKNKYYKKIDLDNNYIVGFYEYLGIGLSSRAFEYFTYLDTTQAKMIDFYMNLGNNTVMNSLKTNDKNNITLVFSNEISFRFNCFEKGKHLQGTELTIHKLKCANKNAKRAIDNIKKYDKNAIVILMADHGSFKDRSSIHSELANSDNIIKNMFGGLLSLRNAIHGVGFSNRLNWRDRKNKIEKRFGVLLAIHYPKQCSDYSDIKFYSLQSVMPLVMACIAGKTQKQAETTLPKPEYSIYDGDWYRDAEPSEKPKKYIINGVVQE